MIKNYDQCVRINHNSNCSYILDHPYRILIIGGPGSAETILKPDIDQILKKNIYASKIHSNLSFICLLMEDKK